MTGSCCTVDDCFFQSQEVWETAHVHLQRAVHNQGLQEKCRRRSVSAGAIGLLSHKKPAPAMTWHKVHRSLQSIKTDQPGNIHSTRHLPHTPHDLLFNLAHNRNSNNRDPPPPQSIEVYRAQTYLLSSIVDSRKHRGYLQYLVDCEGCGRKEQS